MRLISDLFRGLLIMIFAIGAGVVPLPFSSPLFSPAPVRAQDVIDPFVTTSASPNVTLILDLSGSMGVCYGGSDVGNLDKTDTVTQPSICPAPPDPVKLPADSSRLDVAFEAIYHMFDVNNSRPDPEWPHKWLNVNGARALNRINDADDNTSPGDMEILKIRFGLMNFQGHGAGGTGLGVDGRVFIDAQVLGTSPNDPPYSPRYRDLWEFIKWYRADGGTYLQDSLDVALNDYFPTSRAADPAVNCRYEAVVLFTDGQETEWTGTPSDLNDEVLLDLTDGNGDPYGLGANSPGNGSAAFHLDDNAVLPDYTESDCAAGFFPDDGTGYDYCGDGFAGLWNPGQVTRSNAVIHKARELHDNGIDVFVVAMGVGTDSDPVDNSSRANYDLRQTLHATAFEGGTDQAFFSNDVTELVTALQDIMKEIQLRAFSFTTPSVPTIRTVDNNNLYRGWFFPSVAPEPFWEGHLESIDLADDGSFDSLKTPDWDAGRCLEAGSTLPCAKTAANRKIYWSPSNGTMEPFKKPVDFAGSSLDATVLDLTDVIVPLDASTDNERDYLVDYVRGDEATIAPRTKRLGDVFHSSSMIVTPPSIFFGDKGFSTAMYKETDGQCPVWTDGSNPIDFRRQWKSRNRLIMFGSNDGMIHAHSAGQSTLGDNPDTVEIEGISNQYYSDGTGEEVWAYVPRNVLPRLKLSVPSLGGSGHHYYADGSPMVADIWIDDGGDGRAINGSTISGCKSADDTGACCSAAFDNIKQSFEWRTIMLAGLGRGGKGIVALDVTDASSPVATTEGGTPKGVQPMWEIAMPHYTWSQPQIGRVRLRDMDYAATKLTFEKWVAFVGTGYDTTLTSLTVAASPGDTEIFVDSTEGALDQCAWSEAFGWWACLKVCGQAVYYTGKTPTSFTGIPASGAKSIQSACAVGSPVIPNHSGHSMYVIDLRNGSIIWNPTAWLDYPIVGPPALLDLDDDGYIDRVYVGDIGGDLHVFELEKPGGSSLFHFDDDVFLLTHDWTHRVLFQAAKPPNIAYYLPIYTQPTVVLDENRRVIVYFGVGDVNDPNNQAEYGRLYGIVDRGQNPPVTDADLAPFLLMPGQYFDITGANSNGFVGYLLGAGEKVLSRMEVFNETLFFTTFVPVPTEPCGGGYANLYAFHYLTGAFGLDLNDDGVADTRKITNLQDSSGAIIGVPSAPTISVDQRTGEAKMYIGGSFTDVIDFDLIPQKPTREVWRWREKK